MQKTETPRIKHRTCGGDLVLYTDAYGAPIPSRVAWGCVRAYCELCGGQGSVKNEMVPYMERGKQLAPARLRLDPMSTSKAQLGLSGSRRDD